MKSQIKSQINFDIAFLFCILYGIFLIFTWNYWNSNNFIVEILSFGIIIIYLLLLYFANRFEFFDDKFQSVYVFSICKRAFIYNYIDIEYVKYVATAGSKAPTIVIIYKGRQFRKIFFPSNSCIHFSYKRRKMILQHLQNHGVRIEIDAISNKEKSILIK